VQIPAALAASTSVTLLASAADTTGNVGVQAIRTLQIVDAVAPVITALRSADGTTQVLAGRTATVRADATDNVGVTAVAFSVEGAVTQSGTVTIPPSPVATADFVFAVPANAADGSTITVRARARDASGNVSPDATLNLVVAGDRTPPTVTVLSPAEGAQVGLGQTVTLMVQATDNVGVTEISLSATGAASFTETRTISPAAPSRTETFSIAFAALPPTGGSLTLDARARDAAGNQGVAASVTVTVRDVVPPTVAE